MVRNGYEVFFGWSPNQVVVWGGEQHVQVTSRDGQVHDFMIEDAIDLAKWCKTEERRLGPMYYVRLRRFWSDNSNGTARAWVHVLSCKDSVVPQVSFPTETVNAHALDVSVIFLVVDPLEDHFEPNAESFYDLPESAV